ncbi:MAG: type II restriction endonuclease [Candidatus Nealsonbacteria bacterium]
MIKKLFLSLQNEKERYLNAKEGKEFEERIMQYLKMELGFSRILRKDISSNQWILIKKHIVNDKLNNTFLDVPLKELKETFIYQPYGSQEFPDFIIFTEQKIIPLEIKFSQKQAHPIWNSNVPKANAFYVFGSYGMKDLTFFCGNDVLTTRHRKSLYGFFIDIKKFQNKIRKNMPKLDETNRGFTPYIRAAFDQRKHKIDVETNFFAHVDRMKVEKLAIKKSAKLSI